MIQIPFKKLGKNAVIPDFKHPNDAGKDLIATSDNYNEKYDRHEYGLGFATAIPDEYYIKIAPRSSNTKSDFYIPNAPGTLDTGYRGELLVIYKRRDKIALEDFGMLFKGCEPKKTMSAYINSMLSIAPYVPGERVCQMQVLPRPQIVFEEVEELSESERGEGGFGSTGK
jgi:dUTP pyrophosphatase